MTEEHPESGGGDVERHHDLLGLYALAGAFGDNDPARLPGFRSSSPGAALAGIAGASEHEVTMSARLHLLHRLATAGFPAYGENAAQYRLLAASVASPNGIDADALLADLKESAQENVPFGTTASGQAMQHRDVAFIGEDLCSIRSVTVGGLGAIWIFSEFETDAPFDQVAQWVDPRNWPDRGPMMFRGMTLVGNAQPVPINGLGSEHWHGVFHEEVQLVKRVNTLLHCDFWRDGDRAAGMTYELDLSLDGEIDVDRGFLSVNDTGPVRRVKALKIVGFTADIWDTVATMVCPFWTDFVRGAVEGGATSTRVPAPPSPTGGQAPAGDASALAANFDAWVQFFGDSARTYLDQATDVSARAASGSYSRADWLADGTRTWSQLAKDWARAWKYGIGALEEIAQQGLDAGLTPPGTPPSAARGVATAMSAGAAAPAAGDRAAEGATIPLPGLRANDVPSCSRLESIEAGGASIPSDAVAVTVVELAGGTYGARVHTTEPTLPSGLYVGTLHDAAGQVLAPVQLYLARAQEAAGS